MHSILTALVQQPCVPAAVAQTITSAVSQGHADAPAAVFASLSGQGVSPQLTCLGNAFGVAWLKAVRLKSHCQTICKAVRTSQPCNHPAVYLPNQLAWTRCFRLAKRPESSRAVLASASSSEAA